MRSPTRRAASRLVIATTAMGLVAAISSVASADDAPAAQVEQPAQVVPMNYAVNAPEKGNIKKNTKKAVKAVKKEGGEVLAVHNKIGVVIAQTDDAKFVDRMRKNQKKAVESLGATRTSPTSMPDLRKSAMFPSAALEPDPREGEQWGNTELNSLAANEIEGGKGVRVGVLDSGLDLDHPDLMANIDEDKSATCTNNGILDVDGGSYTNSSHGTHVGGTIGAPRNGIGVAGIAPESTLVSINVVNDDGFIFPEYAICGFMYAVKAKVQVTNNSYYIDPWMFWCPKDADQGAVLEAVGRAVDYTHKKGIVNVAAAGNSTYDLANKTTDSSSPNDSTAIPNRPVKGCSDIPAEWDGVVTVSATTSAKAKASFSNYGDGVIDVSGPGSAILSTVPGGGYSSFSGTSMASPHVAGVLALIVAQDPNGSVEDWVEVLEDTAEEKDCPASTPACTGDLDYNGYFGYGIVDALAAVS